MENRIEDTTSILAAVAAEARLKFGALSVEQLNWKPAEQSWSITQCFDHLITTHRLYFPVFEALATDGHQPTLWQTVSPLSGFFGRFLIRSLRPENTQKVKTVRKAEPSTSEIGGDIIDRYAQHQQELIEHLQRIPSHIDLNKTIITSPLLGIITYSLDDTLTILAVHSQRHLGQAERVMASVGFPGLESRL